MRKKRGGGGRGPKVHIQATKNVMVRTWVRKEFPYMRQNEKEIKFIRVGNAVRTVGQLKGPQATTLCLWSHSPDPSPLFSDPQNGDMVFPGSTCESEQH